MLKTKPMAVALTALFLAASGVLAQVEHYTEIDYPPLGEFTIPRPEIYELENGMKVFLMEDHELPLIRATARIRTGAVLEPREKTGLAGLMGDVQRTGGTRAMSGDELDDFLEARAASVETSVGNNVGTVSMDCLQRDFDKVFEVFHDVLRYPVFAEDKLEIAKAQAKSNVARRNDDVGSITSREFSRLIYGPDSPLSWLTEYDTIDAVARDDLETWHQKYYHPNNIYLGLVGDFDSAAMKEKIASVFGNWAPGETTPPFAADYQEETRAGVFYIEKTDVTQANILMGHLGIRIQDPDYFSVQVLNEILGGSFSSRLFQVVRKEKGLAYTLRGTIGAGFAHPGVAGFGLQTKSESMGEAVDAVLDVLRGIRAELVTAQELARAKDSILNSFIFNYASKQQVLAQQMLYSYYGMPLDFLEQYRANIEKVDRDDVLRVARERMHPDEMVLLVVGNQEDFDRRVDSFGELQIVDISIPEPAPAKVAVESTPESLEAGRALLERAARALGVETAGELESVRTVEDIVVSMQGQSMAIQQEVIMVFPDRLYTATRLPMGEQVSVLDGDRGFLMMAGQSRASSAEERADQRRTIARELLYVLRYAEKANAVAAGEAEVDGESCDIVSIGFDGVDSTWCVAADGRVLQKSFRGKHPFTGAPGDFVVLYSDYRASGGRLVPHQSVTFVDGAELARATVSAFEFDPEIDATLFEKPAA